MPALSVVVAARDRTLRLRWLLNALERQTLDRSQWEVIAVHDGSDPDIDRLLACHPLAAAGVLRALREVDSTTGRRRNVGWRAARAPAIVFTHEDCRPPDDWLANALAAVRRHPGAVIQGPIAGDPDEWAMRHAPFWRTHDCSEVPGVWPQPWNLVYPQAVLDQAGGFPEDLVGGEDIELTDGLARVGESAMLTFHGVDDRSLAPWVRAAGDLRDLALVFKRHPDLRRKLYLRAFWKRSHAWLPLAAAGLVWQRRQPLAVVLVVPWAVLYEPRHEGIRGRVRHLSELPGWALVDSAEAVALIRGSIRHRSAVL
jgi:glycosyltransferase involved in cell wall biosynthesis